MRSFAPQWKRYPFLLGDSALAGLHDRAYSLLALADGGCVAVGGSSDASDRPVHMLALRLDANGGIVASNSDLAAAGTGYLFDMLVTPSGQMAVAGVLSSSLDAKAVPAMALLDQDLHATDWQTGDFDRPCRTRCMAQNGRGDFMLGGNVQGEPLTSGKLIVK